MGNGGPLPVANTRTPLEGLLAVAGLLLFLTVTFRAGWNSAGTDFPNYYTAAVLLRESAPLHNYYDWPWFQQQMNFGGVENQLGGYIPQTPLTMLPMLGIASFTPQTAKRIWLLLNLIFLGSTIWLLSRITQLTVAQIWLLTVAGYGTLHTNFLLGQYYVFLLFLLVLAFWCLTQKRDLPGGLLFATAFALKLYGAPFALYFAARRRWKALGGMIVGSAALIAISITIFGWADNIYFATRILPRALQGETLDPYNSGNGTIPTLLRRLFLAEPELNPHPMWDAPWMFFLLQPFLTAVVLIFPLLAVNKSHSEKSAFAWFCVAMILASPNTASYTFILLLLPIALLLDEANLLQRTALIATYGLLSLPLRSGWSSFFPRVFLLLALFLLIAHRNGWLRRSREIGTALALASVIAVPSGLFHFNSYLQQPNRHWERLAVRPGSIYASSPAVLRSGIVYESIGRKHYSLRWLHDGSDEEFSFAGDAFHPRACSPDGPIEFELVANATSTTMLFDVHSKVLSRLSSAPCGVTTPTIPSPDGRWLTYVQSRGNSQQIWVRKTAGGSAVQLTGGNCNSFSPVWELDSKALVFASDCGRGIGLPALYRARLGQ
jgi:hypothetical protein